MGARGPKRTDIAALKLRNSRLVKGRANGTTSKPRSTRPVPVVQPKPRPIRKLTELIRTLPGFDPYRDPGGAEFDEKSAKRAIRWIESQLRHCKGERAGQLFLLEDWQRAIIGNLFGWIRVDHTRRFREALILVGRKNGKTPLAAAIVAFMLFADGEPGAEIYSAASEYRQASLVWEHVRGFIHQNPELKERCTVYHGQARAVQLKSDFSTYRVIASQAGALHGFNSSCVVVDELHALPDSELIDTLQTSTGARRQPLTVLISTSDFQREGSPCNSKVDYADRVRAGIIDDPAFLPALYMADPDDDWTLESTWRQANPNLGVSLSLDYLKSECRRAQESPRYENVFRRLHLNQRTEQDIRWIEMARWDECAGDPIALGDYRDRECFAGLDLATSRDLTALILCFPEDDGTLTLFPLFWIPENTARERSKKDRIPYTDWIRQGLIRATPGDVTDYSVVRRDINALVDDDGIQIKGIALDRLFQGAQLGTELAEQDGFNVVAFGQGFLSMAAPTAAFEENVLQGRLHHGGNPILRWHASNASVEQDSAGNIKPCRKKSVEKIDGIVAAIMACALCAARTQKRSVYEGRGLVFV